MQARTLYDKIWSDHVVREESDGTTLLYIDRHLVHEVTSPQAFEGLKLAGRKPWRADSIVATADHNTPTKDWALGIRDPISRTQVETLDANIKASGAKAYFPFLDRRQGIVHVIGPENGATLPGMTIVCGDSHTSTHGAFAALAFGIGTSEVEHVLATQCLVTKKARSMLIRVDGRLPRGVTAKDLVLSIIGRIGTAGGSGHAIEFAGEAVRALSMEARMTLCNMAIEAGARAGMVGVDQRTLDYLRGRTLSPKGEQWDRAEAYWRTLVSDEGARFDTTHTFEAAAVRPQVTWGTSPEMVVSIEDRVPDPDRERDATRREGMERALSYMGLTPNTAMTDINIDKVFIGSCTNARIEDLREAASIARGHRVAGNVKLALVVPGSGLVKAQAEAEGLDRVFRDAGFEWREPGCSMCLAMNDDRLEPGERCASTSNRNFEGRQGDGGRTHLVSPAMAAAAAPNRLRVTPDNRDGMPQLTTWVKIAPDNTVSVVIPHCEMGTGVHTALAMMCAEELEADWNQVRIEEAPGVDDYANGYLVRVFVPAVVSVPKYMERGIDFWTFKLTEMMDLQVTGGSSAVRGTGHLGMRLAGAGAKAMLLEAAAKQWKVPVAECSAKLSKVTHTGSGRTLTYGELAPAAALLSPPVHPTLKSREDYTIVGKATPRIDIPSKVNGSATYGVDVTLPQMVYATIAASPVHGAKLVSVDSAPAEALPGVKKVVKLDNAVAVVADGYWRALKGVRALAPQFEDTGKSDESSDTIYAAIGTALDGDQNDKVFASGKGADALKGAAKVVEAEYRVPFLAHATMEPMNATARIADGRCEVWTGVQDPLAARAVAAKASGLKPEQVTIHNQQLGGGFGRRLPGVMDFVDQAVRIAKETAPAPVKLIWSREEDIQHDFYRPAVVGRYKAALADGGAPSAWVSKFNINDAAALLPYSIEHQDIRAYPAPTHVRTGAWRSVAHTQHGFFTESFVDELAHAAGKDPLQYRRDLLAHAPRHLAALDKAAEMAGWSTPAPAGRARGIAVVESFGSIVAEVAEVEIVDGRVKVHSVCAAVDCGDVINPDTAMAQVEGGIVFGLSAAVFNEVTIAGGRVAQSNFHDLPMPKLADAPSIKVEFIRSGAALGGLGEPGVPPVAPAIANAVFALTGKRVRSLPVRV